MATTINPTHTESFSRIAEALAPELAQHQYFPAKDFRAADLLLVVHWGTTRPVPEEQTPPPDVQTARETGFVVFDLLDLWRGRDAQALRIAEWDNHPNADGNRLVAERLAALLRENRAALGLTAAFR